MTSPPSSGDLTRLLDAARSGDDAARDTLLERVYDELRDLARANLRRERGDHTLQPTALVHEAYMRLGLERGTSWEGRGHFFAACARAIRRILIEHARARGRAKRGGCRRRDALTDVTIEPVAGTVDVLALDDALRRLAELDPPRAAVVELRFFGGMTIEQTAAHLGLSVPTVTRYWRLARTWLRRELDGDAS